MHVWCLMHAAAKRHKRFNMCAYLKDSIRKGPATHSNAGPCIGRIISLLSFEGGPVPYSTGYEYEKAFK